ncbi:patatin-like phospholipase domain-containing protein 2 isoform X1 [Haplochromis burtoni]|uniref:Patatin-like phospholipase domain-containing protein 2 n=1 Tax=Haplochromis burtoni TaxID=8153 RepID=A0A3Q2V415_HAPBU|nr:patatin-like phospholipase domain-containing protein 2 isoform X1 [Haplochromis burtoni]
MTPGVSSYQYTEGPQSISFSGSGFLATYQLGVAQCFLHYAPWILHSAPSILGSSAGSLVAAAVVCEMNLITIRDEMIHFAKEVKSFTLGPLNPSVKLFHWLECILNKHLPPNAHQLANRRLAVTMTRLTDGEQILMSDFDSKEDVVQALLCSCFLPGYCGFVPPSFKGVFYLDGGLSGIQPIAPGSSSRTLTVCPFSGESDICPGDAPCWLDIVTHGVTLKGNLDNSFRFINAIYPTLENMEEAFHSGYKDAVHFLQSNGPLSVNQNITWLHLETMKDEEEKKKLENGTTQLTSFIDNGTIQMSDSTTQEAAQYPPLHFDTVKNVLLSNVMTYLNMFGLPARILSYLLLPLMLSYYAVLQNRDRLELLFKQMPELLLLTWHTMRVFTFFFFEGAVSTIKKNINENIMPVARALWQKDQAQAEASQGRRQPSPFNEFSSRSENASEKSSPVYKKPKQQSL